MTITTTNKKIGEATMEVIIAPYTEENIREMTAIWNEVVEAGNAFPQEENLNEKSAEVFFSSQSFCGVAKDTQSRRILGLYILHPNNVGRCAHICNASYAVSGECRGLHIGEKLVLDCMERARTLGFGVLQFNAVVADNIHARHLYERLGFVRLGTIPKGFRLKDGEYADICPYYKTLTGGEEE